MDLTRFHQNKSVSIAKDVLKRIDKERGHMPLSAYLAMVLDEHFKKIDRKA